MSRTASPRYHELDRAECEAILERHHVGRIAFRIQDRVDIEPISYVFADGVINCRTAPGSKLSALAHRPWVAFEVDEAVDLLNWSSVVARGTAYLADPEGSEHDRQAFDTAVAQLRRILPETLGEGDPVPFRTVVLRIYVDEMTGRASSTTAG